MTQNHEASGPYKLREAVCINDATVVSGRNRGRRIGIPTINIKLDDIPRSLQHGIYACRVRVAGTTYNGALHYGPRPVFNDTETLEVHIIDSVIHAVPHTIDIEIIGFIREVADFHSTEALLKRIQEDVTIARGMLHS
jgi:riboflavin kinase/FMN adenylyltransferase